MATFALDEDEMPQPGETVEVDLGDGLVALVENTNEPVQEEEVEPPTTYTAVETVGGPRSLTPPPCISDHNARASSGTRSARDRTLDGSSAVSAIYH